MPRFFEEMVSKGKNATFRNLESLGQKKVAIKNMKRDAFLKERHYQLDKKRKVQKRGG